MRRISISLAACLLAVTAWTMTRADIPHVPENVRELMQDRQYEEASGAIDALLADQASRPKNPDYLLYLKGRAELLAGKYREAIATFARVDREHAGSEWSRRARFGQAAALLKSGDFEAAEQIYEEQVKYLLSSERKQEIASIYLEFADAYFDPPKKPDSPAADKKPDYAKALNFYREALAIGPEPDRRVEVQFRIARAQQELGQHAEAISSYQSMLKEHPRGKFDIEARYQLGAVQLAAGQNAEARRTWKDLLDHYSDHKVVAQKEVVAAYPDRDTQRLAESAHGISRTYGIPNPPSKEDLELGVAAAERFMAKFPDIELAARSALEIAQSLVAHQRLDDARGRLARLLAAPRYSATDVIPVARVLLGSVYQRQKKFDAAIGAWQEYLAKHPAHSSWSQVQQAIIDTEFLAALEARQSAARQTGLEPKQRGYAQARRLWQSFLEKYPLDARAPAILLEFGLMHFELGELAANEHGNEAAQAKPDQGADADTKPLPAQPEKAVAAFQNAIADWTNLVGKYPNTEESSRAQYLIGRTYEEKLNNFELALAAYRKLTWGKFASKAAEHVARLVRQELAIETERVFRTNQQPSIKLTTRNIRKVSVKAYRVDLETYFRKMHLARGIESLDIALIDPEKSWTFEIPDYADHRQFVNQINIPLDKPGVMAVTVVNEPVPLGEAAAMTHLTLRPQEATTMVMQSDLDILVKCSRNELFVFAENMRTGKPFQGVKLLVSDGSKVFAEASTGEDGVFMGSVADADKTWDPLKVSNDIRVFALTPEGEAANEVEATPTHFASNVLGLKGVEFAQGISSKGFIYTERPAYRPGQMVHIRGIVRWVEGDQYLFEAGKKFKLDVYDSRNRQIRSGEVVLGEFGSFFANLMLPGDSPQGEYRLHVHDPAAPEKHNYQGVFQVREYQLQPVQIEVETPRKVYYRGDQVAGAIRLRYYYGAPVADREIRYLLPDGTTHAARTDAAGEVKFKFETREFREDQTLTIAVQYPELNLQGGATLFLAMHAFSAELRTAREVFLAGETFDVTATTTDAAGKPIAEKLNLAVVERTEVQGQVGEQTIADYPISTDEESGVGRATVKIEKAGSYVLRATGTDRLGNPVSTERMVSVSGDDDAIRLRILADKHHYKVGDKAIVQLHWRERPALALITYQGARVLGYQLLDLETGSNRFEIPVAAKLAPNFDLTVSVMSDGAPVQNRHTGGLPSFHEASSPFEVDRPLVVQIKAKQDQTVPGEEIELEVTATDPQGKPVRAELSVAMIEKSLLDLFPDKLGMMAKFFQGGRRTSALRSVASCTFRYAPATRSISETLIAEANRVAVAEMERASRLSAGGLESESRDLRREEMGGFAAGAGFDRYDSEFKLGMKEEILAGTDPVGGRSKLGESLGMAGRNGRSRQAGARGGAKPESMARSLEEAGINAVNNWMSAGDKYAFGMNATARYFSESEAALTEDFAKQLADQSPFDKKQMSVLFGDGSVNYVDALALKDGKLAERIAEGGVTILPEGFARETGFWNPAVVTDEQGRAVVKITMPDRATGWQVAARGITTGTLSGQAAIDLTAHKDLSAELKLPLAFTDGDKVQILATIHNHVVDKGKFEVTLKSTIAGKTRDEKRAVEVSKRGVHELIFEREIAGTGTASFELTVSAAGAPAPLSDSAQASVPIRPYGIPVFATAGGSANSNTTTWISPPTGMPVRDPALQIVIGPTVERSLLDVVLAPAGRLGYLECHRLILGESPVDRMTSDLMASLGLLDLLGAARDHGSPEAVALADRVRSAIGYLVSSQNEDGGWHWSATQGAKQGSSDRNTSARGLWSLSLARKAGFAVPDQAFQNAITFVQTSFTAARENDYDGKAALLHSLAAAGRGDFAYANRLYRSRVSLTPRALAYLALAFVELDRKEIARELLDLLGPKLDGRADQPDPAGVDSPSKAVAGGLIVLHDWVEVRALYLIGLNEVRPGDQGKPMVEWLLARRVGSRWQPDRATGPAMLALTDYFASAQFDSEHYKLKVFVNDNEVAELDMDGSVGSRTIEVPKEVLLRGESLPDKEYPGDAKKQRINFELIGRGRFTFQCLYAGFVAADQLKSTVNAYHITRHYEPAPLELDGKEIPRGFDLLEGNYATWRNPVTQLPVGRRAQVRLYYYPVNAHAIPEEDREYVVITEPIPAGCTVLEKSITGQFDRYEIGAGYVTFYVGNRAQATEIRFDLYGYVAGTYRTAPTMVRNYYDPGRLMVTDPRLLTVLAGGETSKDEYRVTPRELYELGRRHVAKAQANRAGAPDKDLKPDAATYAQAARYLTELFDKYQLKPEIYKEVAQMLFETSLAIGKAPEIVRYFEVIKEKWPDLEISFHQIVQVGAAYREMNEYERSYLVFRATLEASFMRESQIGGFLEAQGEFERSIAVMDRILREYPAEPYIASATYALAQRVYAMASNAATDPKLREHKVTRVDLIRQAVDRLDDFLAGWPDDPAADQASFSIASALVELQNWPDAVKRADQFAARFPKSEYLDSFWYIIGYSHFARGEHRAALAMCRRVADAVRLDPATGRTIESRNKWRAIYISGQIYHSLGEPAEAIDQYGQVAERFPDAKETIAYFTRKAIELPEITAVKPPQPDAADDAEVFVELKFRNVARCEVKVYRIDLLKFGLIQRDLANVTKINLAGIKPLYDVEVELGDGRDYRDRSNKLELPIKDEGAYLVVCRGDNMHTSGLVLVTPLVVDVQEEISSGRVRATVRNAVTDHYVSGVDVKVIGSRNDKFQDGSTDLRGVFIADGVMGRATVIARAAGGQYAFHRGEKELGPSAPAAVPQPAVPSVVPADPAAAPADFQRPLLDDLLEGNRIIQERKGKELKELYEKRPLGIPAQQAF